MADRPNPYVFVVGCPRSGTTLLQRILDHHPSLAVTNDTHFIPRVLKGVAASPDTPLTPSLVDRVVGYHRFPRLGVDEATARELATRADTYPGFVTLLYDQVAQLAGKPFAGEKTPDFVRHLPLLHRMFPTARSLHIVRDGREVALSLLDWATPTKGPGRFPLWNEEPLAVAALWWQWQVETGRRDARTLPEGHHLEIRYDQLVSEPETTMCRAADVLGLPFEAAMLEFHVGRTKNEEGLSAKRAWLPPTPGLRNWQARFEPQDLALFEALTGPLLEELGYGLVAGEPTPAVHERAARCRQRFEVELAARQTKALRSK